MRGAHQQHSVLLVPKFEAECLQMYMNQSNSITAVNDVKDASSFRSSLTVADNEALSARLLIVDDEGVNIHVLRRVLNMAGYHNLESTCDPREVQALFASFAPDVVLLDLRMPHNDGFDVLHQLNELTPPQCPVPVIVLTADSTPEARQLALAAGASDFLTKPFDAVEVLLRVRNLLRTRFLTVNLESRVRERTNALEEAQMETLHRLAAASEFRDDDTGQHTQRVGEIASRLAERLGYSADQAHLMRQAAPLHDVGKIGIPDQILLKPDKLTDEEFAIMKTHTVIGAKLLSDGHSELVRLAERIAISHHERWDGRGYPRRLYKEDIPLEGRILAVVDVFDALTHARPYKDPWPIAEALGEIKKNAGTQFDPYVVDEFMMLPHKELIDITAA